MKEHREQLLKLIRESGDIDSNEIGQIVNQVFDLQMYKEVNALMFVNEHNTGIESYTLKIQEEAMGRYIKSLGDFINIQMTHIALLEKAVIQIGKTVNHLTVDKESANLFDADHYLIQFMDCIRKSKIAKPTQYTIISALQVFTHLRKTVESEKEVYERFAQMDATDIKAYFVKNTPTLEKQLSEETTETPIKANMPAKTLPLFPVKQS